MEHFDQVYNKVTGQIGQKWTTGSDPEVIVSALLWESLPPKKLHLNANTEPLMQNLLEKSSFDMVKEKNERMHPFPSSLSDLF